MFDVGVQGSVFIVNVKPALIIKFKLKAFPLDIKHTQMLSSWMFQRSVLNRQSIFSDSLKFEYVDVLM